VNLPQYEVSLVPKNPFRYQAPIDRVDHFYNRRSEVRNAFRLLGQYRNIEVTGPRGIGKTSFLHYISHPDVLQEYGMDPQRNLFVYFDCQHRPIQQGESQVYKVMLERTAQAARRAGVDLPPEACEALMTGTAFEQVLRELGHRGVRTILLLDKFEIMARNTDLDPSFFNNLRALGSADDINVLYVTASCNHLVDLCLERESLLTSPFFNIFQPLRLGLFVEQDSQHLVEDSMRRAGTGFPRDLLELVLEVGGGHPFFLQLAGHHAFNLATVMGEDMPEERRKAFLRRVSVEFAGHFESQWQKLDAQERYVLAALPFLWQDLSYRETIERLRDRCLIVVHNGKCGYFSPLFETFVRHQQVNGLLQAGPLVVDQHRQQVLLRGEPLDLNPTSYALLTYLMQRAGQVASNEELWQAVRLGEPCNADQQVRSSVKNLRKALGNDADYIVNRCGEGYVFQLPLD
jgi:DNA-binding response OmpR family regulator